MEGERIVLKTCPACASGRIRSLWDVRREAGLFRFVRCSVCGFVFVSPRPTVESLCAYYQRRSEPVGFDQRQSVFSPGADLVAQQKWEARRFLLQAERLGLPNAPRSLLDVGAGFGIFSQEAQVAGYEVTLVEPSLGSQRVASALTGQAVVADSFEDLCSPGARYSVILMSQVLEHANDIGAWLQKAYHLLIPGGVLVVALPNFGSLFRRILKKKDPFVAVPDHLNYFSPSNLSLALTRHGFRVERVSTWSRVSRSTGVRITARMPLLRKPLTVAINSLLRGLDPFRLGMLIDAYARKPYGRGAV